MVVHGAQASSRGTTAYKAGRLCSSPGSSCQQAEHGGRPTEVAVSHKHRAGHRDRPALGQLPMSRTGPQPQIKAPEQPAGIATMVALGLIRPNSGESQGHQRHSDNVSPFESCSTRVARKLCMIMLWPPIAYTTSPMCYCFIVPYL